MKKETVLRKMLSRRSMILVLCVTSIHLSFLSIPSAASRSTEEVLTTFVTEHYPWNDLEISNIKIMGKAPATEPLKIEVEKGPLGKAAFSFYFSSGKKIIVRATVKALDSVIKTKRPFKRGHVIQKDDVFSAKMDIRRIPKSAVKESGAVIGKPLKRSITANVPLVEDMVEQSLSVKRGQKVVLVITRSGLNITAAGKTKEKGHVGKPVKAINLSSKKEVRGILIDENTVKVEL